MNFKKILSVIVVVLVVCGVGYWGLKQYATNKMKTQVSKMLDTLKAGERTEDSEQVIGEYNSDSSNDMLDSVNAFEKIEYKINKVKVANNFKEGTIDVSLTNKNMKTIIGNYMTKAIQLAFASAFSDDVSEDEMNKQMAEYLKQQIESSEVENITTDVEFHVEKKDGKWIVKEEDRKSLANAVLPGFEETINQINTSLNN